jgi:hypothetical protein
MMKRRNAALRDLTIVAVVLACLCAASPVTAQKGVPSTKPDAGWGERDYLLHYAKTVCVRASYATLKPEPAAVLEALAQEAWAMVEFSSQGPEIYDRIHRMATGYGSAEAPARALAGCSAWGRRNEGAILEGAKLAN